MGTARKVKGKVVEVHARLFEDDVRKLKAIAQEKLVPWQQELRLLVHHVLNNMVSPERKGPNDPR